MKAVPRLAGALVPALPVFAAGAADAGGHCVEGC